MLSFIMISLKRIANETVKSEEAYEESGGRHAVWWACAPTLLPPFSCLDGDQEPVSRPP